MEEREWMPCPFCGSEVSFDEADARRWADERAEFGEGYLVSIECHHCNMKMMAFDHDKPGASVDEIIDLLHEKWNRRLPEMWRDAQIKKMYEDLKSVSEESHEYAKKYVEELKRNAILETAIVMGELNRTCPELAASYRKAENK